MDAIWSKPQGGSKSLNFFDLLKHLLLQWLCCLMTVASDTAYANMVASKCWLSRYIRISPYGDDSLSWRAMRGVGGGAGRPQNSPSAQHFIHFILTLIMFMRPLHMVAPLATLPLHPLMTDFSSNGCSMNRNRKP